MEEKVTEANSRSRGSSFWCLIVLVIGVLVVTAAAFTVFNHFHFFKKHRAPTVPVNDKYAHALEIALQFFDVQKSGKLGNDRISWRGDSGLEDGSEWDLDLSKGMYDAGDAMKFGFPMAFTATILSWAILEYGDRMNALNQLGYAHDSLRWITDYLINAHPSQDVLYIQVGDPGVDHKCWERPETMTERRPAIQVNTSFPGTEVAAETAAALASASLVFKRNDPAYSNSLFMHAQQLFSFADTYRGSYSISIPQVQQYYNSTGYGDELLWAASWLYHATGDELYLNYVTNLNEIDDPEIITWFSWDDKLAGAQVLLSRIIFLGVNDMPPVENLRLQMYRKTAETVMCSLLPDSPTATSNRTDGGLIWITEWNSLQNPVASAFLAILYSDYMLASQTETLYCSGNSYNPNDLRNFAISQADYVLGANPMKMSYLVGYGSKYPQYVHHRGSSIPVNATTGCKDGFIKWYNSDDPNPNIAFGALVGGPSFDDSYFDNRTNLKQGEPSTYNTALLVGLLSGLLTTSSELKSYTT